MPSIEYVAFALLLGCIVTVPKFCQIFFFRVCVTEKATEFVLLALECFRRHYSWH